MTCLLAAVFCNSPSCCWWVCSCAHGNPCTMSLCWLGLGSSAGTAMLSAAEHSGLGDWKYMGENLLHEKIWSVYASFKVMGSTENTTIRLNAWKHLLIHLHEHTSDLFHLISFLPVIEVDKWLGMWKIRQIWPGFVFCNKVSCSSI